MPKVPRLSDTANLYSIAVDEYGDKTKTLTGTINCRFFEASGKIKNNQGEYITYDAYLHTNGDTIIQKGDFITVNSKDYQVEYAGHTKDLKGNVFMQYITLVENYATT